LIIHLITPMAGSILNFVLTSMCPLQSFWLFASGFDCDICIGREGGKNLKRA
jgi:hypothetical protein